MSVWVPFQHSFICSIFVSWQVLACLDPTYLTDLDCIFFKILCFDFKNIYPCFTLALHIFLFS